MCITDLNFLRESQGSPQFLFLVNGRDDVPSSSRPIPVTIPAIQVMCIPKHVSMQRADIGVKGHA